MKTILSVRMYTKFNNNNNNHNNNYEFFKKRFIFFFSIQDAAKIQNRKIADDVPEKLYKDYLSNKYKKIVGNPKWAKLEKSDGESDDLDNEILKVFKILLPFQ